MKLSERMEKVQGPASYWIGDAEQLEAENERYKKALKKICATTHYDGSLIGSAAAEMRDIAIRTLKSGDDDDMA